MADEDKGKKDKGGLYAAQTLPKLGNLQVGKEFKKGNMDKDDMAKIEADIERRNGALRQVHGDKAKPFTFDDFIAGYVRRGWLVGKDAMEKIKAVRKAAQDEERKRESK